MADKFVLIKKPRTTNGVDPLMKDGGIVYKNVVLPEAARTIHEKYNEKLPQHLKFIIEDYTPPVVEKPAPTQAKEFTIDPAVLAEAKGQQKTAVVPEPTPDPPKQTSKPVVQ